ncbi:hypothetical protein KY335_04905 [Candidatus Woesearchaeota archaeon]|nr:hypothetical protein [Candidatus Woesearchaeota archaeon]MBW3014548.1 hypothetical protein [Candidatus Woesearchaeota archaeon]
MEYYEEDSFEEKDWDEELESDGIDPAERGLIEGYERTAEEDEAGGRKGEEKESFEPEDDELLDDDF